MKDKIPKEISSKDLLGFAKLKPDILHLKQSYLAHTRAFNEVKDCSHITAFYSLATAIEVYLKIHYIVYTWTKGNEYTEDDILEWCNLLGKKPQKKISIDPKSSYSHNIPSLLEAVHRYVNFDSQYFQRAYRKFQTVFGNDWATKRYSTEEIRPLHEILESFNHLQEIRTRLQENHLDVIDRIKQ